MKKKHIGSFFESILEKSPDLAAQLENMAEDGTGAREKGKKQPSDPLEGVEVERRRILTPKRKKAKPTALSSSKKAKSPPKLRARNASQGPDESGQKKLAERQGSLFRGLPDNAHQFGLNDRLSRLDVIIGVDFGTSSTKVVIHVPAYPGRPAYAVPFGDFAHQSLEYLLPTRLFVSGDGRCEISPEPDTSVLTEMKIGLMRNPNDVVHPVMGISYEMSAVAAATAYLANVLRYVRCWFLATKRNVFGSHYLHWSWNLGLPAAIDDNPGLRQTFELVGRAGWLLSRRPEAITRRAAYKALNDVKFESFEPDDMPFDFGVVPEVIAEVSGYARSPLRNEGLHLLLDAGASTLDVCSFNVATDEGEDYYPIYTADVDLLGSHRLHDARIRGGLEAVEKHAASALDVLDPLTRVPDTFDCYVPAEEDMLRHVEKAQEDFVATCGLFVAKTLADLKKKRDPNSPRWDSRLPIFLCGGASAGKLYQDVFASIDAWLKNNHRKSEGARLINLPKPEELDANIHDSDYHRLAVAWGLSRDLMNIGHYDRPSEIEDIPSKSIWDYGDKFVSKDMV